MNWNALIAIIKKDIKLFLGDRRAMIITLAVPIAIASFFGGLTGPRKSKGSSGGVPVQVVNLDTNATTVRIVEDLKGDANLKVEVVGEEQARKAVIEGKVAVAILFPSGFGEQAPRSFFGGRKKPEIALLHDPSKTIEMAMAEGLLMQYVMREVGKETFSPNSGRKLIQENLESVKSLELDTPDAKAMVEMLGSVDKWMGLSGTNANAGATNGGSGFGSSEGIPMPFSTRKQVLTSKQGLEYNGYAHSFGGMSMQFVLMASVDAAVIMLLERRRGMWRRLRAAPLNKLTILGGRGISAALLAFGTMSTCWLFSMLVFGVKVGGSWVGFLAVNGAIAIMAATVGLMLAAIGKTPEATRGVSIFFVLILVMLGGAWVPSFIFPAWLQTVTLGIPTRWAVDGLDAMTWRGLGLESAVAPVAVMLGYSVLFGAIALWRFRWEVD